MSMANISTGKYLMYGCHVCGFHWMVDLKYPAEPPLSRLCAVCDTKVHPYQETETIREQKGFRASPHDRSGWANGKVCRFHFPPYDRYKMKVTDILTKVSVRICVTAMCITHAKAIAMDILPGKKLKAVCLDGIPQLDYPEYRRARGCDPIKVEELLIDMLNVNRHLHGVDVVAVSIEDMRVLPTSFIEVLEEKFGPDWRDMVRDIFREENTSLLQAV